MSCRSQNVARSASKTLYPLEHFLTDKQNAAGAAFIITMDPEGLFDFFGPDGAKKDGESKSNGQAESAPTPGASSSGAATPKKSKKNKKKRAAPGADVGESGSSTPPSGAVTPVKPADKEGKQAVTTISAADAGTSSSAAGTGETSKRKDGLEEVATKRTRVVAPPTITDEFTAEATRELAADAGLQAASADKGKAPEESSAAADGQAGGEKTQGVVLSHSVRHQVALPPGYPYVPLSQHVAPDPPARSWPFTLDPFQRTSISSIERGESVLVSAHTSAGKTVVAEYAIAQCLRDGQRVVYTSPIKVRMGFNLGLSPFLVGWGRFCCILQMKHCLSGRSGVWRPPSAAAARCCLNP